MIFSKLPKDINTLIFEYASVHGVSKKLFENRVENKKRRNGRLVAKLCRQMGYFQNLRSDQFGMYADPRHLLYFWFENRLVGRYIDQGLLLTSMVRTNGYYSKRCRSCHVENCLLHGEIPFDKEIEEKIIEFYKNSHLDIDASSKDEFTKKTFFKIK